MNIFFTALNFRFFRLVIHFIFSFFIIQTLYIAIKLIENALLKKKI